MEDNLCAHVGVKKNLTEIAEFDRKVRLSLIGTRALSPSPSRITGKQEVKP